MEALLRVEHLKKQFHRNSDGTYVLKDISFEMMPGECLGLIGNSGSGKSTIVKILTGITTATKGCIYLEGKQISGKRTQKGPPAWGGPAIILLIFRNWPKICGCGPPVGGR